MTQEERARWTEEELKKHGFPPKSTKLSWGSFIIFLGDRRSVDVYKNCYVLAFFKDGKDHIYEFNFEDFGRLIETLEEQDGSDILRI